MSAFLLLPSHLPPKLPVLPLTSSLSPPHLLSVSSPKPYPSKPLHYLSGADSRDFRAFVDDADGDSGDSGDYDMDDDEVEEVDNKKDFDVEYEPLLSSSTSSRASSASAADAEIEMVQSKSFVSTRGGDSDMVVNYRIDEEEFHKISLMDCDFFIRKPPDPDNDVYDFREMYVTPPDTDVYSIPKVLSPMPQKYIRCAKSDYGRYNMTEPPIDAPRDPMYKCEKEILKIFLTKHYRNRRLHDPEFVLDFEEIYILDSKTNSITRAKVLVTAPGGRTRDRKTDLLVIRDNGNSFKITHTSEREDPTIVIEREEWTKTREDMERHLRKLRDFSISNWI